MVDLRAAAHGRAALEQAIDRDMRMKPERRAFTGERGVRLMSLTGTSMILINMAPD